MNYGNLHRAGVQESRWQQPRDSARPLNQHQPMQLASTKPVGAREFEQGKQERFPSEQAAASPSQSARSLMGQRVDPREGGGKVGNGVLEAVDIVQYACPIFFVENAEGSLKVDVMRLGKMEARVSCMWHTRDGSATAGREYCPNSGEIIFEDGQTLVSIEVKLVKERGWAATLEFQLALEHPVGCELGKYLHDCRVKIINNEAFPSNKYRDNIFDAEGQANEDGIKEINDFGLFIEFCKLMYKNEGINWRTVLTVIMDQMSNAYRLLMLWVSIYMVDVLFSKEKGTDDELLVPDRVTTAFIVAGCYAVPVILLHCWELAKGDMDVMGRARVFLQKSLFRKYLNYSEDSRRGTPVAEIEAAVMTDCRDLAEGYIAAMNILLILGKLCILTGFTLKHNPGALWVIVVMGAILGCFAATRNTLLQKADDAVGEKEVSILHTVSDISHNYLLVACYMRRPQANQRFATEAEGLRKAQIGVNKIKTNNSYAAKWLGPFFTFLYIVLNAKGVIEDGTPSLGAFLATIRIFDQISGDFAVLYNEIMLISRVSGALKGMTLLLNKQTDLKFWKGVNRNRRIRTKAEREEIFKSKIKLEPGEYMTDKLPINLTNMCYSFSKDGEVTPMFENVNVSVKQGQLVSVLGGEGSGKTTFLKLLGHMFFPTTGEVFIPTHLRILHVTQEPMLVHESLWKNLTFGDAKSPDPPRIRKILEALGMKDSLKRIEKDLAKHEGSAVLKPSGSKNSIASSSGSDEEESVGFMGCSPRDKEDDEDGEESEEDTHYIQDISYTEKGKIHVARAIIMNPEVLVLQRPLYHFNQSTRGKILDLFRQHVENRGYALPEESKHKRRPRTVIFSTANKADAAVTDMVWALEREGEGVCYVKSCHPDELPN